MARGQAILDDSSHETGDINDPTAAGDDGLHMLHLYTEASFRLYRSRNSGSYWRFGCRKQQLGRLVNSRVGRIASWTVRPTKYGYQREQSSLYHFFSQFRAFGLYLRPESSVKHVHRHRRMLEKEPSWIILSVNGLNFVEAPNGCVVNLVCSSSSQTSSSQFDQPTEFTLENIKSILCNHLEQVPKLRKYSPLCIV